MPRGTKEQMTGCFDDVVMDIETPRLVLHAIDEVEARRIFARVNAPQDRWAVDYPFSGDLVAVGAFLRATERLGDQRPFGYYQIVRAADGLAVGGAGFKGPPHDGTVEVGYGLAPSARGSGYASEALTALVALAASRDVHVVLADTTPDNIASQRTLVRAGFSCVRSDESVHYYEQHCV